MLVIASLLTAAGCGGRGRSSVEQLAVLQYRYNFDEKAELARVYGLVRNMGDRRTPPADVVVTLVGSSGSMKGQDRREIPPLKPGEDYQFALEFTSHGKTEHVEIQVVPRGAELTPEPYQPSDAEEKADG